MSFTTNYSQKAIFNENKTVEFIEDNTSISNRSFDLVLELDISIKRLSQQADTFASNFITHGYIDWYRTFRLRDTEMHKELKNLYIYSFVKCLYNGMFYSNINENSNLGHAFRGHCCLFHILKSPYNSGNSNDLMLSYRIGIGSEIRRKALFLRLLTRFKFLSSYKEFEKDSLGTSPFIIFKYERYMNTFKENYYIRSHIEQGDNATNRERLDYPNGRLSIFEVNSDNNCKSILMFSQSPHMNTFLCKDRKTFYYFCVQNGKSVVNNPSFFYNIANFISMSDKFDDKAKVEKYYNKKILTKDQGHFICSEVFTNTGIKCRSYRNLESEPGIKLPALKYFEEQLEKIKDKIQEESIINKIFDSFIEDIDLDIKEVISTILGINLK